MNGAYFITFANHRWLSLRVDVLTVGLLFTASILIVISRFTVAPFITGVIFSSILPIAMMLQTMDRRLAEVENTMNATERIHYHGTELPLHKRRSAAPPNLAEIVFDNISMRYRPGLPLVLKTSRSPSPAAQESEPFSA